MTGYERLYYLADANPGAPGNVTCLVDTGGDAVERYVYDPYGNVTIYDDDWSETRETSSYDNNILYCGYYHDSETGLYHVRYRYYHPPLGRWTSRDPVGYADGMGLYEAMASAPTTKVDPQGTSWKTFWTVGEDCAFTGRADYRKSTESEVVSVHLVHMIFGGKNLNYDVYRCFCEYCCCDYDFEVRSVRVFTPAFEGHRVTLVYSSMRPVASWEQDEEWCDWDQHGGVMARVEASYQDYLNYRKYFVEVKSDAFAEHEAEAWTGQNLPMNNLDVVADHSTAPKLPSLAEETRQMSQESFAKYRSEYYKGELEAPGDELSKQAWKLRAQAEVAEGKRKCEQACQDMKGKEY